MMNKSRILVFGENPCISPETTKELLQASYLLMILHSSPERLIDECFRIKPDLVLVEPVPTEENLYQRVMNTIREQLKIPVFTFSDLFGNHPMNAVNETAVAYGNETTNGKNLRVCLERTLGTPSHETNGLYLAWQKSQRKSGFLCVRSEHRLVSVKFEDILFVEAMKDYVLIYTDLTVYTSHISMKEILRLLPYDDFIRVHRSFIVRLDKISSIKYPELMIAGKIKVLPIGGYYRKALYEQLIIV